MLNLETFPVGPLGCNCSLLWEPDTGLGVVVDPGGDGSKIRKRVEALGFKVTALLHTHHAGWTPWVGDLPHRQGGAMMADRLGVTTAYALDNLQSRGELFVGPGEQVYEGMIVGENSRPDDMMINVVREKQKTNIRTHSADEAIKLVPPKVHTLESAIEFIAEDELVEVTPSNIRIRKRVLKESDRRRLKR